MGRGVRGDVLRGRDGAGQRGIPCGVGWKELMEGVGGMCMKYCGQFFS